MADASVRNISTGDSTDDFYLFTHRTKWNTFLALSLSIPCQCMQVL